MAGGTNSVVSHQHLAKLSKQSKRHAVVSGREAALPLWVFSEDDWAVMLANRKNLQCPEPGCEVRLFPRSGAKMARHLWLGPQQGGGCDHWTGGSDGAPMTPRHLWVQTRILELCRELGYAAVAEHHDTRADVFVAEPATALEVQLRPTSFVDRTASRRAKGADTIWFIGADVSRTNASVRTAIAQLPTVRFKVVDRRTRGWSGPEFTPWEDLSGEQAQFADIRVYGTVFDLNGQKQPPSLEHAGLPMRTFLHEVLSGDRVWVAPGHSGMPTNQAGRPRPGWIRPADLVAVTSTDHTEMAPRPAPVVVATTAPQPAPVSAQRPEPPPESAPGEFDGCLLALVVIALMVALILVAVWLL